MNENDMMKYLPNLKPNFTKTTVKEFSDVENL